jgi:uncharacterized protein YllA (UPF0747 family)
METSQTTGQANALGDYASLSDLVDACAEFYRSHADRKNEETLEARRHLSDWIRKFHSECGTLTSQVEQAIEKLRTHDCLLLMAAHQPNLFAYGGVLRKVTLEHVLAERLAKSLDVPVIKFFGLADQDFTDDRWVRSAQVPDSERRNGVLELRVVLPEKTMLNRTPKPAQSVLDKWLHDVDDWIHRKTKAVIALGKTTGVQLDPIPTSEYSENLKQLWSIVTAAHERAQSYADFNAFVISGVINGMCGYDTLFCRFSECQRIFKREFSLLIQEFQKYSRALQDEIAISQSEERGVRSDEYCTMPVWYHCDCGGKARLTPKEVERHITGWGACLRCGKEYEIDFSENSEIWADLDRVSARALTMPLIFFNGLDVTCYVGGVGGREYLRQAKQVTERMGKAFPPIAIWRPRDRYLGLAQLEALLTIRPISGKSGVQQGDQPKAPLQEKLARIQGEIEELESTKKKIANSELDHSLKVEKTRALSEQQNALRHGTNLALVARQLGLIENAKRALDLHPCMVDYAINFGMKDALGQWEAFLNNVGDLSSDISMRTKLDRQLPTLLVQQYWATH